MRKNTPIAAIVLAVIGILTCGLFVACAPAAPAETVSTVTFVTQTDDCPAPVTAKSGSKIYPPADPSRDGYRFDGWTLDGQPFEFDTMPDRNITLDAAWTKLYALSFDTGAPTQYYAAGETIVLPDAPEKDKHKFTGWKVGADEFTSAVMPEHDVALTAGWVRSVTITLNTGVAGFTVDPIVDVAGAQIAEPVVNRRGYYVMGWKLNGKPYTFSTMPSSDITLTADLKTLTNLPSMFIDLTDASGKSVNIDSVDRKTYVKSSITLTNADDEYIINKVPAGFRGRGNGSWEGAGRKNGYKIKFDKKQSLFGQTANKHWVILACTNFDDVTMSRNYLAFNMGREVFSAIEHTTIAEWVDIYINGNYHGLYLLCEHTRVGSGRVDISSEYTADPEHNGFLVEYDAYADKPNPDKGEYNFVEGINYFRVSGLKYPFSVHSPDPEDYAEEGISAAEYRNQVSYIKDYVSRVYAAALGGDYATFAELADVASFVDMYILHELFKNVDCGYSSFYLYKKPDGKLYAGPPWDFDATTNINERGDRTPRGLYVVDQVLSGSDHCASELYINLYKNASFRSAVVKRWKQLSPDISAFIERRMNDGVYAENKAAMGKNFAKWKGLSQSVAEANWVNDMKTLKKWFTDRIAWLDGEWK